MCCGAFFRGHALTPAASGHPTQALKVLIESLNGRPFVTLLNAPQAQRHCVLTENEMLLHRHPSHTLSTFPCNSDPPSSILNAPPSLHGLERLSSSSCISSRTIVSIAIFPVLRPTGFLSFNHLFPPTPKTSSPLPRQPTRTFR